MYNLLRVKDHRRVGGMDDPSFPKPLKEHAMADTTANTYQQGMVSRNISRVRMWLAKNKGDLTRNRRIETVQAIRHARRHLMTLRKGGDA
jgi:hypothetical protein